MRLFVAELLRDRLSQRSLTLSNWSASACN